MLDYPVSALMKADNMNPRLASEPISHPHHHENNHLEMPLTSLLISNGMDPMYAYRDDLPHIMPYSPTQSYSSSNSTDTERQLAYDGGAMYQLQSPTVSDLSAINQLSPQMPPSPPLPPRVYKPCVVCSDKSSGYHYTVSSCEGCKGFFRRSIQKNMQYTCLKEEKCEINKVTRNRCQFCRLNKCIDMGMSKEAVRNDRKKKKLKSHDASPNSSTSQQIENLTDRDKQLIDTILRAHSETFPDHDLEVSSTDESDSNDPVNQSMLNHMLKMEMKIDSENGRTQPSRYQEQVTDMVLWGRVSELSELGIQRISKFAKRVPGFVDLTQSDRITLLKASALEIVILRLCLRYDIKRDVISFACGMSLDRLQIRVGGFGSLTEEIFKLAASFRHLDVNVSVISMLTAICLVSGDRSGLEDTVLIESTQEPLLIALGHYISINYPTQPRLLAKLLMKLTDLRKISIEGAEEVLKLSTTRQTTFSPLLEELLIRSENVDLKNPDRLSANIDLPPEMMENHKSLQHNLSHMDMI